MVIEKNKLFELAEQYILFTQKNIFLTGKAGTGKTTFLRHIRSATDKELVVLAPTGVAAINAGGVTIHSFFQLPLMYFLPDKREDYFSAPTQQESSQVVTKERLIQMIKLRKDKLNIIRKLELIVIDEVSMLRCDTLDAIDWILRNVRRKFDEPFGGVQMLFIGDLFQLPPVVNPESRQILGDNYSSPYFFSAKVLENYSYIFIELENIFRQKDSSFINILNNIRNNRLDENTKRKLEERYFPDFNPDKNESYIILTTHNNTAQKYNNEGIEKLKGKKFEFKADITGDFNENFYPAELMLTLKIGAQVMFIKNDKEKVRRYFNGKIGIITSMSDDSITVKCNDDDTVIEVERESWQKLKYSFNEEKQKIEEEVTGSFIQFPLRLAWAVTVHKSQGLTFEKAIIDVGEAFTSGQVYVALSRCTTLEGIVLKSRISKNNLFENNEISTFYNKKQSIEALVYELQPYIKERSEKLLHDYFNFSHLSYDFQVLKETIGENKGHLEIRLNYQECVSGISGKLAYIQEVGDKFQQQLQLLFHEETYVLNERLMKAGPFFKSILKDILEEFNKIHIQATQKDTAERCSVAYHSFLNGLQLKIHLTGAFEKEFRIEHFVALKNSFKPTVLSESYFYKSKKIQDKEKYGNNLSSTYNETLLLYQQGKSLVEIATERQLSPVTIESHFAKLVEEGKLDATKIKSIGEMLKIKNYIEAPENQGVGLKDLVIKLGEGYSYGDIKITQAYFNFICKIKQ